MRMLRSLLLGALCVAIPAAAAPAADAPKAEVGKPAPSFDLPATAVDKVLPDKKDADRIRLKDFEGKKNVVLFFFPKAMTRG